MSQINPKSLLENKAFLLEQAQKAADTPITPAKEAALLSAIESLGQDVALLNERALTRVTGLDEGLKARAVIAAFAMAYGPELKAELYRSSNIGEFAKNIMKERGVWDLHGVDRAINRFVTMWRSDVPLTARDGQELDLASIASLEVRDGPMKDKLLKNVGPGDWTPVSVDPHAKWAAFEGESFGVLRLDNGEWAPWFQNDWNKDQFTFQELSSASLRAIRERLSDESGFRGLGKQIDRILAKRSPMAEGSQSSVLARMQKLDLNEVSSTDALHPIDIMGLPAQARVSRLPSKDSLLGLLDRLVQPAVGEERGTLQLYQWSEREIRVGDEFADILHAGQPIIKNGAHLTFTAPNQTKRTYQGGLVELSNRKFRLWTFHPVERQGSFPAKNYFDLDALDTASLQGLRQAVFAMTPEGAKDAVMGMARKFDGYGVSFSRLVHQIDAVLVERQAS